MINKDYLKNLNDAQKEAVTSLNGLSIGDGKVGTIFSQLINRWSENTGVDIISQIQKWDADRPISSDEDAPTPYRFSKK